jgi:hypothetical protein
VAGTWASVLHAKYGVYTTGSQFKVNLLQWTLRVRWVPPEKGYAVLRDVSSSFDQFGMDDPAPPGSAPWRYHISVKKIIPSLFHAEMRNLPLAIKETTILITPGGVIAFFWCFVLLLRNRKQYPVEFAFALVIFIGAVSLVLAYCMLVFDGRYAQPLVPLLIAVSIRPLLRGAERDPLTLPDSKRLAVAGIVVLGAVFFNTYWSSPVASLDRDFQASCYDASRKLQFHRSLTLVSIGEGPYPAHGVGWEAGFKAAFFSNRRVIAWTGDIVDSARRQDLLADVRIAAPDTVMVWGASSSPEYVSLIRELSEQHPRSSIVKVYDPTKGEVASILFLST